MSAKMTMYTLAACLVVASVGAKMPVVIIAGFLPMFFAAYAYREFNKVAPDAGTSFTWTTKAFGPYVGWFGGWAAILATVIVLSNLAGVAVAFFYQFLGELTGSDDIGTLWENRPVNVITCLVFLAIAMWVAYRGITTTEHVQFALVGFQMVMLLLFAVLAYAKSDASDTGVPFSLDWFSPSGLTMAPHSNATTRRSTLNPFAAGDSSAAVATQLPFSVPQAMPSARPAADGFGQPIFCAAAVRTLRIRSSLRCFRRNSTRSMPSVRAMVSMCISRT